MSRESREDISSIGGVPIDRNAARFMLLVLIFGAGFGIALGLLGGGGSIVTVPA